MNALLVPVVVLRAVHNGYLYVAGDLMTIKSPKTDPTRNLPEEIKWITHQYPSIKHEELLDVLNRYKEIQTATWAGFAFFFVSIWLLYSAQQADGLKAVGLLSSGVAVLMTSAKFWGARARALAQIINGAKAFHLPAPKKAGQGKIARDIAR